MLAPWVSAGTELVSNDPNWLGGRKTFNTTEGNDFWLTFMNNGMFNPADPKNASIQFEMQVAVSAREAMDVIIAADNAILTTLTLAAGQTKIFEIDRSLAEALYLYTSEEESYKGVHVYAAQKDKDKFFSCFLYNRAFDSPLTSRDASIVIPTRLLGKEYIIQTYPQDVYSSEFAIVASEDNTVVNITPTFDTNGGKPKNTAFTITLSRGQAYLVASKKREEGSKDFSADLTGSLVCADKPVAVFNGNQQTGIPNKEGYSQDFLVEQAIPITQWGTEFYLSKLANTISNYAHITALEDGTNVQIYVGNTPTSVQLNRGKTQTIQLKNANEVIVKADKPLICYDYTTTAAENNICTTVGLEEVCYIYGDPSNAMMPAWKHHVPSMTFYTGPLDPQNPDITPQHFYVYVVTKTDDIGKFTLNGTPVAATSFSKFQADATMAYAHIKLPDATERSYHLLETTGEGFVGMVYGITEAQAYFYTLGFTPNPEGDSLFINNEQKLMSYLSYDMDSLDGHGWYQRQWDEWVEGKERLDTAVVCDSSTVYWTMETYPERPVTQIEWNLYDLTTTEGERENIENGTLNPSGEKHKLEYQFILPVDTDMENRHQFYEYELELILHRNQIICGGEEIDTFRTVTRVTRIFNDTIWRAICLGDTLPFFKDSLFNQDDTTQYLPGQSDTTLFIPTKAETGYTGVPWNYKVGLGKHTFTRQYVSQFGCDSIITLELFVCDTFRFVDTVHICDNQDTVYHEYHYRGTKYDPTKHPITDKYPVQVVIADTTVQYRRFKTDSCDCQKGELAEKYKDIEGKKFQGCDSIYELHLYIHKSYDLHVTDTLDYHEHPDSTYTWYIERNGQRIEFKITKNTPGMVDKTDLKQQAWVGDFSDTLYTKTCKECNNGAHGCDSINSLTLIIPPVYYFDTTITHCRLSYDWSKHDTLRRDFQWFNHHHDTIYNKGGEYYDSCVSRYGADSVYHLKLIYSQAVEPLYEVYKDTVCFDSLSNYHWEVYDKTYPSIKRVDTDTIPQDILGMSYYIDNSRCDTIYALELYVLPTYFFPETIKLTQEETYYWPVNGKTYGGAKTTEDQCDTIIKTSTYTKEINFYTTLVGSYKCDSIHKLTLNFGDVYRDTIDTFACGQETEYVWWETRPKYYKENEDGVKAPFIRKTIPERDLPKQGETIIFEDPYQTVLGDDSIFYLKLYRAPIHDSIDSIRVCQAPNATFNWPGHGTGHKIYDADGNLVTDIPAEKYSHGNYYEYIDTLRTTYYGCDSIWHLHLYVDTVYHFTYEDTTCQFSEYVWPDQDIDSIDRKIITTHTGDSVYTATYHTGYGCDSIWTLKLHIDTVYLDYQVVTDTFMCDKDSFVFIGKTIYGYNSPFKPADVDPDNVITVPEGETEISVYLDGFIPSSLGCDSAVRYNLIVYRTYFYDEYIHICQPSEGRDSLFHWVGHDTVWDVHNSRFIPADSIPRYVKGDTTYLYIDSLHTTSCERCPEVKGGCDSLFFLYLTIDSTYHFYDTVHICENEEYTWQNIHFVGDSMAGIDRSQDTVRAPGIYHERVAYNATHGCDTCSCDSIYYLELIVTPIYYDTTHYVYYDNNTTTEAHYYTFTDTKGNVFEHYIPFKPHRSVDEKDTSITYYNPIDTTLIDTLQTVDGCDSVVSVSIRILPTYEFTARGRTCFGDYVEWRGNDYYTAGTYFDSLKTEAGGDSVFVLYFFVNPVTIIPRFDTICESETFVHRDTIWHSWNDFEIFETVVWKPGNERPQKYSDVIFKGHNTECDSLIYRYYLTIRDTFTYHAVTTMCSGDTFYSAELDHAWEKAAFDYDTDRYVLPYDTVFIDSLMTVHGCDSLYYLHAHVLPSYRHVVYDTLCENDTCHFRRFHFLPSSFGDTIVRDTMYTRAHHCDSIFELRLSVYPKFYDQDFDTVCADSSYLWRDKFYPHFMAGDTILSDSLLTHNGCDSVYQMFLHVLDTTFEINYDTICIGDTLTITQTGHIYTVPGDYKDTTVNEYGCRHFIYTHLAIIPPTVPTVWAEDPMCQSQTAFDLFYTYTSHYPIAFSLYFDSIGKSMGFEDMEDVAITDYSDPMVISVPIPYRDPNDPTTYPRPDNYSVRLVLDNGFCQHKETDCFDDSTFMMSYPAWLTEQRYGDVIALLNDKYNGGYTFSSYQWYQGEKKLIGQTNPYLYVPTGLVYGDQYHVVLTRQGEKESFPTCPITISLDPRFKDYAPTMGFLDVAPTCVTAGHPYITILSRHGGTYRITTSEGSAVSEGSFHADATEVTVPSVSGMYIVQLWSDATPEEPYRAVKIVVKDRCETCATSF